MPKGVFVVFSNPSDPSVEDDFNDWYNGAHVPDVLEGVDGMRSAVRYRRSETQILSNASSPDHKYLIIWEVVADDLEEVRTQIRGLQGKTPHSDAMDWSGLSGVVFEQITDRVVKE